MTRTIATSRCDDDQAEFRQLTNHQLSMTSQTRRLRTTLPLRSNPDRNRLCLTNSYRNGRSHVVPTEASTALLPVAVGRIDEWHLDFDNAFCHITFEFGAWPR